MFLFVYQATSFLFFKNRILYCMIHVKATNETILFFFLLALAHTHNSSSYWPWPSGMNSLHFLCYVALRICVFILQKEEKYKEKKKTDSLSFRPLRQNTVSFFQYNIVNILRFLFVYDYVYPVFKPFIYMDDCCLSCFTQEENERERE